MLEVKDLTITIDVNRPLVKNLSFVVNEGDKVAIIGEEGNGKTTLLKSIYCPKEIKSYAHISGSINIKNNKIGYLAQFLDTNWDKLLVKDYFLRNNYDSDINYDIYNELGSIIKIFISLNLSDSLLDQKISTLSGGEKVKMQLAKIIFEGYDILLLDEPTNDLDIETLELLEEFILNTKAPIIYISHDETLLEKTANAILHMEQIKKKSDVRNTFEKISYLEYVENRQRALDKQTQLAASEKKAYMEAKQILSHQKSSVRSVQIKIKDSAVRRTLNKKMKNILSQEKKLENKDITSRPDVEDSIYSSFDLNLSIPNNKIVLDYKLDKLKVGNKTLAQNIHLVVKGPSKVVITGRNGCGKTTLLNKIYDYLKEDDSINVSYMPQNYSEELDINEVALDYLKENSLDLNETIIRAYMGNMKFTKEEMITKINNLSGGQKAKLMLLKMIFARSNVLILDEPTRNLSPLSNPVIREMLKDYKGAIISVSHDRKYIKEVCDINYELTYEGLKDITLRS